MTFSAPSVDHPLMLMTVDAWPLALLLAGGFWLFLALRGKNDADLGAS
ncbi:MAG: hypothetical protein AAGI51_05610 [Pseudomonadota bacterium]